MDTNLVSPAGYWFGTHDGDSGSLGLPDMAEREMRKSGLAGFAIWFDGTKHGVLGVSKNWKVDRDSLPVHTRSSGKIVSLVDSARLKSLLQFRVR